MRILIIGATSKLASCMLTDRTSIQRLRIIPLIPQKSLRYGTHIPDIYLKSTDAVVNFAYATTKYLDSEVEVNKSGALLWANQIERNRSQTFIQISSDAVRFNADSEYSKIKSEIEEALKDFSTVHILRLPTLIGPLTPDPLKKLIGFLETQLRLTGKVFVPNGFIEKKILWYLKTSQLWDALIENIQSNVKSTTPISHKQTDFFSIIDLWFLYRSMLNLPNNVSQDSVRGVNTSTLSEIIECGIRNKVSIPRTLHSVRPFIK